MQIHRTSHNNSFEREYFTLGGCAGPEMKIHRASHNNSFERIFLFGRVNWSGKETPYEQATITALRENISLWEGVLVLEGKYIEQATITILRENISLWEGVLVLKGEQATITAFQGIFLFGRVWWS